MKVNISIDDALVKRLDAYVERNYTKRSAVVTTALNQFLNANELVQAIQDMAFSLRRLADAGAVDEEGMKELESYAQLVMMLASSGGGLAGK